MENAEIELAKRYVNQTGVSVFLTGKAGTGKTTFLKDVDAHCAKRHVVVAPTGVAAVNAGGVTIHSFFQLPFEPYLPDVKELVTEYQMADRYKSLNKNKTNIIRTLELLIIDEISMVRADLLDAIDMTLRRVRRSSRPFGGVQLLMIGDVHQLAPVVTERERAFMERVYPSPFFFHSKALQQVPYVTIELTKVYRQQDEAFVEMLNRVRENDIDAETLGKLNSRVEGVESGKRKVESEKSADAPATNAITQSHNNAITPITLTTHNRQADAINAGHMRALDGESRVLEAVVEGNYPESAFPAERELEVKVGERVMFLKNDSSGGRRYYNGKLGTVGGFSEDPDEGVMVEVDCDDGESVSVGREVWENMKYTLDAKSNEIKQEVDGTFRQYPLRAAWAVTIHKAQGLTFDRVRVNAADAFAFGQVYVALSRCRSLEGLTLTTPLSAGVAFGDRDVEQFVGSQPTFDQAADAVDGAERQYYYEQLADLFGADALLTDMERLEEAYGRLKNIFPQNVEAMGRLRQNVAELASVGERFKGQLMRLQPEEHAERVAKGAAYYAGQLSALKAALGALLDVEVDNKENDARIKEAGAAVMERVGVKLSCMKSVEEKGFDVVAVQKAKTDFMLGDKSKKGRRGTREPKEYGAAREPGRTREPREPRARKEPKAPKERRPTLAEQQAPLVQMLTQWRREKAEEQDIPHFHILQQKTLMAIVNMLPRTMDELLAVPGIGRIKADLYGREILDIVDRYFSTYAQ
ncbi:MAG: AAA family ATPase [Bacteroidales bacterium]|nr:AAA family ATPase [Bacteroidales bacterium]